MPYIINKTSGEVFAVVPDGAINRKSSQSIVGANYSEYGELLGENFIRLLENANNDEQPENPLQGQLWYDNSFNALKIFDGVRFNILQILYNDILPPSNPGLGYLWFNPVTKQLFVWNGYEFILVGPDYTYDQGLSGDVIETIKDTDGNDHVITKVYVNEVLSHIISKDLEFTPDVTIPFFPTIKPGIQLPDHRYYRFEGVATGALDIVDPITGAPIKKVNRTGDTMTGTLNIDNGLPGNNGIGLNISNAGYLYKDLNNELAIRYGISSNYKYMDFNNDGNVGLTSNPTPSDGTHLTTKNYTDDTYVNVTGDTMTGQLIVNAGIDVPTSNGTGLSFENGKHWITANDGGGNFNIRVGNSFADGITEDGYASQWNFNQLNGIYSFNVTQTSQTIGQTPNWLQIMRLDPDGNLAVHRSVTSPLFIGTATNSQKLNHATDSESSSNSTIVKRTSNGYIYGNYFNNAGAADTTTTPSHVMIETNSDGFIRPQTLGTFASHLPPQDATTLDGLDSTQFLRSDASDTYTGGRLRIQNTAGQSIGQTSQPSNILEVYQPNLNTDAIMQFHVAGDFGVNFGLDGGTNRLSVGGWSMGAVSRSLALMAHPTQNENFYANQIYANGWLRTNGSSGWINDTYGGGMYMVDTTYVRTYGSKQFFVNNQILSSSNIVAYFSDERLKDIKKPITGALDTINNWRAVHYTANDTATKYGYDKNVKEIGLITQDIEKDYPELIHDAPCSIDDDSDYKTLNYDRVTAVLVSALQDQIKINKKLQDQIDELNNKVAKIIKDIK